MDYPHQPVLVNEVVNLLIHAPDGTYVDGTVGCGGHSFAIGNSLLDRGSLICLDRDPDALDMSKKRLSFLGDSVRVIKANYSNLDKVLEDLEVKVVDGVLLDLGMSSYQLDYCGRGFSFNREEPLDMRMDPSGELTAHHLVNDLSQKDLQRILKDYGEERRAKSISRAIVRERTRNPIETSLQLADLVKSVFPPSHRFKGKNPATRTFQALRIAVNRELYNLEIFLKKIPSLMARGGRLLIISYHSLEDRLVKKAMVNWEKTCICPPDFPCCVCGKVPLFRRLVKKGVRPDQGEIDKNLRARSAIMRICERV